MHSSFDLEVYAKAVQDDFRRVVAQNRLIDEAQRRGKVSGVGSAPFGRLLSAARSWLSAGRSGLTSQPAAVAAEPANVALIVASDEPQAVPSLRPARSAEPYAGMAVIARGTPLQTIEEPSGARER
jgi:hypothetical protein